MRSRIAVLSVPKSQFHLEQSKDFAKDTKTKKSNEAQRAT